MKMIFVVTGLMLMAIFMISAVSAADEISSDNLTAINSDNLLNDSHIYMQTNKDILSNSKTKNPSKEKVTPSLAKVKYYDYVHKYKENKYYKIKITDKKTKKPIKNLKFKFKIELSKGKYKTYTLKTDKNGVAKYNTKKLKTGVHGISIYSKNYEFIEDFDWINIWKTKKTATLKMNTQKKVNGEYMYTFSETSKNAQYPKGVYVTGDIGDENPGFTILKAKFFFKNKKTGKIISKTTTSETMSVKLIKGYTPIKTKVWYGTLK